MRLFPGPGAPGGLLYVLSTTSMGLLISAFTRTQIAAILGTMIITSAERGSPLWINSGNRAWMRM